MPVASQRLVWIIAIIGRGSSVRFGIPACQSRMSRMSMLPRRTVGWIGGTTARRASSSSDVDLDVVADPDAQLAVGARPQLGAPFSGEMSTVATLTTSCAGGCATSSTSSGQR